MHNPIVRWVKEILPPRRWRAIRRATNRLRWVLKFQLLRNYGFPIARRPIRALQYILVDPEVESFSYEIENEAELTTFLARLLGEDAGKIQQWINEAKTDPILARDRGFHWSSKRRQPLGNRLMWYPIVRSIKPRVIVEAGVHEGLGSETLLAALAQNGREGHPGRLISFDIHEDTGWLVSPELKHNWQFVLESTLTGLEPALRGHQVDVFIHETPHTEDFLQQEFDVILRHAGPRLAIIDSSGLLCPTLRDICKERGVEHHYFLDKPRNHIVTSYGSGFAILENQTATGKSPQAPAQKVSLKTGNLVAKICVGFTATTEILSSLFETGVYAVV